MRAATPQAGPQCVSVPPGARRSPQLPGRVMHGSIGLPSGEVGQGSKHFCGCGSLAGLCLLPGPNAGAAVSPPRRRAEPRRSQDLPAVRSRTLLFFHWELLPPPLRREGGRKSPGALRCPQISQMLLLRGSISGATQTCKKSHAQATLPSGSDVHSFIHPSNVRRARCWERSSHPDQQGCCCPGGDTLVGTRNYLCPASNSCFYLLNICVVPSTVLYALCQNYLAQHWD